MTEDSNALQERARDLLALRNVAQNRWSDEEGQRLLTLVADVAALSQPDHWMVAQEAQTDEYMSVTISRDGVVTSHNAFDANFDEMVAATRTIIETLQVRLDNRLKCPFAAGKELRAPVAQEAETEREGCVGEMTPKRATYFLERFKRDEKMLGPHEQWALDYAIAALAQPTASAGVREADEWRCPKCGVQVDERYACCEAPWDDNHPLIERLLDAQQDINFAANTRMDHSLCDVSALIDEIEPILRAALNLTVAEPSGEGR